MQQLIAMAVQQALAAVLAAQRPAPRASAPPASCAGLSAREAGVLHRIAAGETVIGTLGGAIGNAACRNLPTAFARAGRQRATPVHGDDDATVMCRVERPGPPADSTSGSTAMPSTPSLATLPSPPAAAQRPPLPIGEQAARRRPPVISPEPALDALHDAYRASGGLLTGDEVALRLRDRVDQPLSRLARWIVAGELLSIETCSQTLIPQFQFDPATMTIRTEVADLMAELSPAFDGHELAAWFVAPNAWLLGATPVEALTGHPQSVLDAARADRFVATGWA